MNATNHLFDSMILLTIDRVVPNVGEVVFGRAGAANRRRAAPPSNAVVAIGGIENNVNLDDFARRLQEAVAKEA